MNKPQGIHDHTALAAIAEQLRDARAAGDRKLVAEGRMAEADAATRLRVASALAADWRRVADLAPRPEPTAADAEILAMLQLALPAAISRRDRAHQAMVAAAPQYRRYRLEELWALSDASDAFGEEVRRDIEQHVRPRLYAESIAAGVAAMLWWAQRTGCESIHWLTDTTIALREQARPAGEGRLAA